MGNSFQDTFLELIGNNCNSILKASYIESPLGKIITIADEKRLYLLQFADGRHLAKEIDHLKKLASIYAGNTEAIDMIREELELYFEGKLQKFKTPVHFIGSEFQKSVWQALMLVPYGSTRSYLSQAKTIGNAKAFRAVANANGANYLSIIVPCHRIIYHNGKLGGYGGGLERKKWLLNHEKKHA